MGEVQVRFRDSALRDVLKDMEGAAAIAYFAEYAPYVEFETAYTSKKPPFDPLFEWVKRKWSDLDDDFKTDADGNEMTQEAVAWKLQQIIFEHGTEGVHFGGRAMEQMRANAEAFAKQYEGSSDPDAPRKLLDDISQYGFEISQDIIADEATDTGNLLQSGQIVTTDDPTEVPD